jgi:hypothetical protein
MSRVRKPCSRALAFLALSFVISAGLQVHAETCCDPAGPFVLGEAYPEQAATCETIEYWMNRAPNVDARISLAIRGALTAVEFDGTLAYLVMCDPSAVQVMCVTYSTNGREPGDVVLFGGGYIRVGEKQIMLDPCLASPE